MTILVTGAAGFIGYHTAKRLCQEGLEVIGIDNLNSYYDVALKQARLAALQKLPEFRFHALDIVDKTGGKSYLFQWPDLRSPVITGFDRRSMFFSRNII